MERNKSKKVAPEASAERQMDTWRKIGGGSLRLPNRIIKPGQVFKAFEEDIPKAFRNVVERISTVEKPEVKLPIKKLTYKSVPVEGEEGLFNIVDSRGKQVNEEPLTEEVATEMIKTLEL